MLKHRIIAGTVITVALLLCLWHDATRAASIAFTCFMAVGTVVVLAEFYRMVKAKGAEPMALFGLLMGVLLVFAHDRWCWEKWHGLPRSSPDLMNSVLALSVFGCCAIQGARRSPAGAILNLSSTLMGLIYVWFLPGFLVKIRHLGMPGAAGWQWDGVHLMVAGILVAKASDIGGFFAGRRFGRHKLSPVVSPKKTWEGAAGGVAGSIGLALAIRAIWPASAMGQLGLATAVLFGLTMAVTSLLGDLLASSMKRDSGVKDSGGIVPGYGGLLDVVDSLMVSAPAAYFFLLLAGARPALET